MGKPLQPSNSSDYLSCEQVRKVYGYSSDYLRKLHIIGKVKRYGTRRKYYWVRKELDSFILNNVADYS